MSFDCLGALLARAAATPDALLLDIGANVGGHTWLMRQAAPHAIIHAFEPIPQLAEGLRVRYASDPLTFIVQEGVSDVPGRGDGYAVHEAWTLAKPSEARRGRNEAGRAYGEFSIYFTTVDRHMIEAAAVVWDVEGPVRPSVPFIKIDTDGYEFRVLRGAERTLLTERPNVLIELSYMPFDLGDNAWDMLDYIYGALGYVLIDYATGAVRPREYWTEHTYPLNTSFDVGMVPKERPL